MFVGVPTLLELGLVSITMVTIPLLLVTVPAVFWLGRHYGYKRTIFWVADARAERQYVAFVLQRFMVTSGLLLAIAWLTIPEHLFDIPRQRPAFWVFFMLVYPLASVYPQELLYRVFFFRRYAALVADVRWLILLNALMFSWAHVVFHNITALVYTFIGSLYFAQTYNKTGSLRLVCLEHALYGVLLVTIGYGHDFLTSNLLHHLGL